MSESDGDSSSSATIELPEKTYFKIGEVAKFLEVEPYVLRYWETEFDILAPEKTNSGQRVYQRDDIELLFQIRTLLYEEMFTIAGACRQLERNRQGKSSYFDLESTANRAGGTAVAGDEELHRQLESARRELAAAETELSEVENQFDQVKEQLLERREELADASQKVESLQERVVALREESSRRQTENEQLSKDLAEARQMLEERSAQASSDKVASLERQVAELEARLEEAKQGQRRRKREVRKRRERRRKVLSSLRREVETVAAMADASSGSV